MSWDHFEAEPARCAWTIAFPQWALHHDGLRTHLCNEHLAVEWVDGAWSVERGHEDAHLVIDERGLAQLQVHTRGNSVIERIQFQFASYRAPFDCAQHADEEDASQDSTRYWGRNTPDGQYRIDSVRISARQVPGPRAILDRLEAGDAQGLIAELRSHFARGEPAVPLGQACILLDESGVQPLQGAILARCIESIEEIARLFPEARAHATSDPLMRRDAVLAASLMSDPQHTFRLAAALGLIVTQRDLDLVRDPRADTWLRHGEPTGTPSAPWHPDPAHVQAAFTAMVTLANRASLRGAVRELTNSTDASTSRRATP